MNIKESAIVTISDPEYVKGTLILLYSFLKYNPWFDGSVIIIEDTLRAKDKKLFEDVPNLIFRQPSKEINERVDILTHFLPQYEHSKRKFYSLEAFNLKQYHKVLYMDSDVLCRGNLSSLFEDDSQGLKVSADYQTHLGKFRHFETFQPTKPEDVVDKERYLQAFNSGVMMINHTALQEGIFNELLRLLTPVIYANVQTGHADQYLLNRFFANKVSFLSERYNYLLHAEDAGHLFSIHVDDALLVHFSKGVKPWNQDKIEPSSAEHLWAKEYLCYHNEGFCKEN